MGAVVDKKWNEGKGARYLQLRNFEFGCGKSWDERAGPGRYFTPIRRSFYCGVSFVPCLLVFRIFERPMVIDSLNLNLSQISCQIVDFNRFVDLRILADFQIKLRI